MERIVLFGKGGIGKSTIAANLAAVYALQGKKVLLVGCDPKHDTTVALTEGAAIRTVVEQSAFMDSSGSDLSKMVVPGRLGIDCVEAGGPEPGIGCAGRGISRMIELLEEGGFLRDGRHDVALFDVLGDVVCGGFAAPLRHGLADKVVIVASEELMALYAANNIARAIKNYSANGISLVGLIANLRDQGADRGAIERLAAHIGTRVLDFMKREPAVREAEYRRVTLVEHAPKTEMARKLTALAGKLLTFDRGKGVIPHPLSDEAFHELSRKAFAGRRPMVLSEPSARDGGEGPVALPAPAPAPQAERAGPGKDPAKELAWQAKLWEGSPGPNSQVWGSSDQWRRFYCDFETRRHARTRLEVGASVINIWHQDLECSYATPNYFDERLPSFFKFPWPRVPEEGSEDQPGEGPGGPGPAGGKRGKGRKSRRPKAEDAQGERGGFEAMTNLRDLDVIHGGGRKLEDALKEAVRLAPGRADAVVVHSTCVPTVIGDDAESVIERWRKKSKVPILYSNPAQSGEEVDVGLSLLKKIRQDPAFTRVRKLGNAVNLVGFPEGPALNELVAMLIDSGITVNSRVLPRLKISAAKGYLAAPVQVLYPNSGFDQTYKDFFEPLPIRSIRPDAPYGFAGTRRWLEAVAAEFGLKSRMSKVFAKAAKTRAAEWDLARKEAGSRGLAFVVDVLHAGRLNDPAQMWGVPLLKVLGEMGFSVEILCFGKSRKGGPRLSFFQTPEELASLLKAGKFEAVYSEYAFDPRLAQAGKAQFALDCFESGLGGAVRTARKLNEICRWPFNRRYARYMSGGS